MRVVFLRSTVVSILSLSPPFNIFSPPFSPFPFFPRSPLKVVKVVKGMKQGPPLHDAQTDCGAIPMGPKQLQHFQALVDDAVRVRYE